MDLAIDSESGPLSLITPMALRPAGVPNATIVSITTHPVLLRGDRERQKLFVAFLKTNPKLTFCAFPDGFRLQVFTLGQSHVNDSPFLRSHRSKSENRPGGSDLSRGVQGHRP